MDRSLENGFAFTGSGAVRPRHSTDFSARRASILARLRTRNVPGKLDEISEAIGALRTAVKNLAEDAKENSDRAAKERGLVIARVEDLAGELFGLANRVESAEREIAATSKTAVDAKKVTDEVTMWKQRGVGALFVTGIGSAALTTAVFGFIAYWWDELMKLLRAG